MELGVFRKYPKELYTIGRFSIDGSTICNTLEPPVRELHDLNHDGDFDDPGEGKIYGHTAIPCGRYKVGIMYRKDHKKYYPILEDVTGFVGILIHSVATVEDTEACIGVGENKSPGRLENGLYWSAFITQKVKEAIENKEPVFITIKQ
jgi:hypothetical protein